MTEPHHLDDPAIAGIWRDNHRHLMDVAYRMLGSVSDAEDIVQEAFTRLLRTHLDEIEDARGWLVVVVSRLCLDQLRSARVRREAYVGPWLPEPVVSGPDAVAGRARDARRHGAHCAAARARAADTRRARVVHPARCLSVLVR